MFLMNVITAAMNTPIVKAISARMMVVVIKLSIIFLSLKVGLAVYNYLVL